jgi:hypothetical protein
MYQNSNQTVLCSKCNIKSAVKCSCSRTEERKRNIRFYFQRFNTSVFGNRHKNVRLKGFAEQDILEMASDAWYTLQMVTKYSIN